MSTYSTDSEPSDRLAITARRHEAREVIFGSPIHVDIAIRPERVRADEAVEMNEKLTDRWPIGGRRRTRRRVGPSSVSVLYKKGRRGEMRLFN